MPDSPPQLRPSHATVDVSVVMPVRDEVDTVAAQVAAVAAQLETPRAELVVVDNGSTDGTRELVLHLAAGNPRVRLVDVPERGINLARNTGLAAARGDKVVFCDGDDVVADGWIVALSRGLDSADLVFGDRDEELLNPPSHRVGGDFALQTTLGNRALGFLPSGSGSNLGVRRDVALAVGGFDVRLRYGASETDFCWRVQLAGHSAAHVPDAVVHYRHPERIGELARKRFLMGMRYPYLYRKFHPAGMRRRPTRLIARHLAAIVVRAPLAWTSPRTRRRWVDAACRFAGLLVGSVRYRSLYL